MKLIDGSLDTGITHIKEGWKTVVVRNEWAKKVWLLLDISIVEACVWQIRVFF